MTTESISAKYELETIKYVLKTIEDDVSLALSSKKVKEGISVDYRNILAFSLGKSVLSMREVIVLCENGFPDGALSIARNIFEQFIIIEFLNEKSGQEDFDKLIEKYNDDFIVKRGIGLQFFYSKVSLDEQIVKDNCSLIEEIKEKYGLLSNKNKEGYISDYWWSGCSNLREMCDKIVTKQSADIILLIRYMQSVYQRACLSIHASCMGNQCRLGSDYEGIDMGPWDNGQQVSLFLGCASLLLVAGYTYDALSLDFEEIKTILNELTFKYKKMQEELYGGNVM